MANVNGKFTTCTTNQVKMFHILHTYYRKGMKRKKANGKYAQVQCKQPRDISNSSVIPRGEGGWNREKEGTRAKDLKCKFRCTQNDKKFEGTTTI